MIVTLYSQNFEGLAIGADMEANGFTHYPYLAEDAVFVVASGKVGSKYATVGGWGGSHVLTANDLLGDNPQTWGDITIEFDVTAYAGGRWNFQFRSDTSLNRAYTVQCLPGVANEFAIDRAGVNFPAVGGGWGYTRVSTATCPATTGHVKIILSAGNIKVYFENVLYHDYTDASPQLTGSIGMVSYAGGWKIDNIVVTKEVPDPFPTISGVGANVTSAGATITWDTDVNSSSQVEYGLTTAYGFTTTLDPSLVTSHLVEIAGLVPRTTYHYRVISTGPGGTTYSADYTFTTLLTSNKFGGVLRSLFPRGRAWSRDSGSLPSLILGASQEMERADEKISDMLNEMDTRYADELLSQHEEDLGLSPEPTDTVTQRRNAANAQLIMMGGQDPSYFVRIAAARGYSITIDEFRPAWCGVFVTGEPCGDQDVLFTWRVNVAYSRDYTNPTASDLLTVLERIKPAHTQLIFRIGTPGFSRGFSAGFDALPKLTDSELAVGGFRWRGFSKGFDLKYGGGFKYGSFTRGFNNLK